MIYSGLSKTSQSLDASEENDGWSSAEDPFNSSDVEEEGKGEKKLVTFIFIIEMWRNIWIHSLNK